MPSILSRLRMRTLSQHSSASTQSATGAGASSPPTDPPALAPSRSEPLLVDRRIVEDLPALLGSLEATHAPSGALWPSRPRKRSGLGSLGMRSPPKDAQEDPNTASEKENAELRSASPTAGPSAWRGKQRQASTNSPWSTFGRHRRHARSPYGTSGRSSRIASADSTALRTSSIGNVGEGQSQATTSNLASTASVDHHTNSRLTETQSSHVSVLSTLTGSLSNRSSHSYNSAAVTFGVQSPSPLQHESAAIMAYTSMPVFPSTYSTESVPSRTHTFPGRRRKRKTRAPSGERDVSRTQQVALNIVYPPDDPMHDNESESREHSRKEERLSQTRLDSAEERPADAAPRARRVLATSYSESPCSPPPRLIPPSSSPPSSSRLLDAEKRTDGAPDNLSRTSRSRTSSSTHIAVREEESWMADPRNVSSTLNGQASDTRDASKRNSSTASRTRSKRPSILSEPSTPIATSSSSTKQNGGAGPSSAAFPTISTPPPPAPQRVPRTPRTASEPGLRSVSEKSGFETPLNNKGKRKADDVDLTPPDQRTTGQHATFVIPADGRRSHHVSEVSRAPSSYQGRKRARLSTASPSGSPSSRPASVQRHPTDSWPSRTGVPAALHRVASKTTSTRSARPESSRHAHNHADRRRSMSEISFPISALVAPHAPSVSVRSGGYYMRDPRKPPRIQPTPWGLHMSSGDEQGSPVHAWMFFVGFVLFPLWWLASFWRIPQTRRVGGTDTEKAVTLDDPQVEHDARSWRKRCRIMSVVSFLTYIPFIVLVAVFVPRS